MIDPDSPQAEAQWLAWCELYERRHEAKKPSKFEAIEIFRENLPTICLEKIAANEQPGHFKSILHTIRKWASGDKRELNIAKAKAYDITRLAEELSGGEVRFHKIRCPKGDDTPSLHIYEDTNSFWCFAHQHGSDTIDLLSLFTNLSFKEAVTRLSL